jgi:hypothetical protein
MFTEISNIKKDIKSGSLPHDEIVPFIVWALGRTFWYWFIPLAAFAVWLILK